MPHIQELGLFNSIVTLLQALFFPKHLDRLWHPPSLLFNGYGGSFSGGKELCSRPLKYNQCHGRWELYLCSPVCCAQGKLHLYFHPVGCNVMICYEQSENTGKDIATSPIVAVDSPSPTLIQPSFRQGWCRHSLPVLCLFLWVICELLQMAEINSVHTSYVMFFE